MKLALIVLAFSAVCVVASPQQTTKVTDLKSLGDLVIQHGDLRVNNLTVGENATVLDRPGMTAIHVSMSVRNASAEMKRLIIQLVGLNDEGIPIWASACGPMGGRSSAGRTEEASEYVCALPGTLQKTVKIWVNVVSD